MAELLDFSYARLTPAEVRAAGRSGVIRYVTSGRPLVSATRPEVEGFRAAGLTFCAVWQRGTARALDGETAGAADAADAELYCAGLGATGGDPVYMAVDMDVTTGAQLDAVVAYFTGAASVLGWRRLGAYGDWDVIDRLAAATPVRLFWQSAASSHSAGRLHPAANLHQYRINQLLNGKAVDYDRSLTANYGQWGEPMPNPAELGWGDPRRLTSADMVPYDIGEGVRLNVRNADVGVVFAELVRQLMAAGWDGPRDPVLDDWGYARRLKRWAQAAGQKEATAPMSSWSEHAWGTAVDLDTVANPMLARRPADIWAHCNLPRTTAAIAVRLGLDWGGTWSEPWDPQHFQIAGTPAQTKALAQQIRDQEADVPLTDADIANLWTRPVVPGSDGVKRPARDYLVGAADRSLVASRSVPQVLAALEKLGDDEGKVLGAIAAIASPDLSDADIDRIVEKTGIDYDRVAEHVRLDISEHLAQDVAEQAASDVTA